MRDCLPSKAVAADDIPQASISENIYRHALRGMSFGHGRDAISPLHLPCTRENTGETPDRKDYIAARSAAGRSLQAVFVFSPLPCPPWLLSRRRINTSFINHQLFSVWKLSGRGRDRVCRGQFSDILELLLWDCGC